MHIEGYDAALEKACHEVVKSPTWIHSASKMNTSSSCVDGLNRTQEHANAISFLRVEWKLAIRVKGCL